MPGGGDTKHRAKRIDPSYLKEWHWLRSARGWIGLALLVVAGAWIAMLGHRKDRDFASPGRIAAVHRTVTACEKCHIVTAGVWSRQVSDKACQNCHRVPDHQPNRILGDPSSCAGCHVEHRDNPKLIDVAVARCTRCHGDLDRRPMSKEDREKPPAVREPLLVLGKYRKISTFGTGSPSSHRKFEILLGSKGRQPLGAKTRASDASRIKFSHKRHLSANLMGPPGTLRVRLVCGDCHRGPFEPARLPYRGTKPPTNACATDPSTAPAPEPRPTLAELPQFAPAEVPQYFAPVRYQDHCAACHPHTVDDPRIHPAPHDTPAIVRAYLQGAYARLALDHPELLDGTPRKREIAEGAIATSARATDAVPTRAMEEWARGEVARAEDALYRRSCPEDSQPCDGSRSCDCCRRCIECHYVSKELDGDLPAIVPPAIPSRWLPHSRFDHAAHRDLQCVQCHRNAKTSEAATDVLLPKIGTCQKCHHAGGASERCAECHTYHGAMEPKDLYGPHTIEELTASSGGGGT